jgi:hypothetical protein
MVAGPGWVQLQPIPPSHTYMLMHGWCMTDGLIALGAAACSSRKMKQRQKKMSSTSSLVTSVPDFDGYQWRKYGQKQIEGAMYARYVIESNNNNRRCHEFAFILDKVSLIKP